MMVIGEGPQKRASVVMPGFRGLPARRRPFEGQAIFISLHKGVVKWQIID